jgi:hypothetical protein
MTDKTPLAADDHSLTTRRTLITTAASAGLELLASPLCPKVEAAQPKTPAAGDPSPSIIRDIVFTWLYVSVSVIDRYTEGESVGDADKLAAQLCKDLTGYVNLDQGLVQTFAEYIASNYPAFNTVSTALVKAVPGWSGGGHEHPKLTELQSIFIAKK